MISPPLHRIVVIGPESTGKTRTSMDLAEALGTVWVPEYARTYLESLSRPYKEEDLELIAQGQLEREDQMAKTAQGFLVCDTDLYVIKIWSEYKFGRCSPWILHQIAQRRYDLYLLGFIDIPWEEDPFREHPDPAERKILYQYYLDHMVHSGRPFRVLKGRTQERLTQALESIHSQFKIS